MILKTGGEIKDIPLEKKSKNIWIVLLKDLGSFALYLNKSNNCFSGFEVHKIKTLEASNCIIRQKSGNISYFSVPKRRVIANDEKFGRYAWHYPNLNLVYEKHPIFRKYNHEIERRLKSALESINKTNLHYESKKKEILNDKHHGFNDCHTHFVI